MNHSIIIDPRLKYNYASWYLLGLQRLFGKRNLHYDVDPFTSLPYADSVNLNAGMAFVVDGMRVFIDFEDVACIFQDRYDWCDVYAKVNPTKEQVDTLPKLMAIGPQFGVTLQGKPRLVLLSLLRYWQGRKYNSVPYKLYLRDYLYTAIRRRPIEEYEKSVSIRPNYIFHASTLWYNEFAWTCTNRFRGEFLRACQAGGVEIEGGLFFLGESPAILSEMPDYGRYKEEYKDFIYENRLSMDDYIRKTKESVVVFNTPAVCECHGWKLAEYLCMGKAIISTPLTREMPGEGLEHGKNVHFVEKEEDICDAVVRIRDDASYRQRLEQGARAYYEKYLAPEVVIKRILGML